MIDFVSTREGVDTQTAACARLLSSVIVQAITDASSPLSDSEKKEKKNINGHAISSIRFLFGQDSVFPLYADLIGSSAESIRSALLNVRHGASSNARFAFNEGNQRIMLTRLRWLRMSGMLQ